ncbi:MAG: hypothetical protein ACKVS8_05025 [Phycisphaerales bacterium]
MRTNLKWLALAACLAALPACEEQQAKPTLVIRKPAPAYGPTAAAYNADIAPLDTLWCRATTQLRYTDSDGDKRIEQGEGHLQVVRPDKVALSIGKVGQILFWLGCDENRYWWMELTGDEHLAYVGLHDGPARAAASAGQGPGGMVGSVSPRSVARVLAIVPLPEKIGTAEWTADGKQVILTSAIEGDAKGTRQRVWMDPQKLFATRVQLVGPSGKPEISAELSEEQFVTVKNGTGAMPAVAGKVFVSHPASNTEIRLFLEGLEAGGPRIKPAAFNFEQLCKALRVDKVIDLDEQQRARDGVGQP